MGAKMQREPVLQPPKSSKRAETRATYSHVAGASWSHSLSLGLSSRTTDTHQGYSGYGWTQPPCEHQQRQCQILQWLWGEHSARKIILGAFSTRQRRLLSLILWTITDISPEDVVRILWYWLLPNYCDIDIVTASQSTINRYKDIPREQKKRYEEDEGRR